MQNKGKLILIPVPLGEGGENALPQMVIDTIHRLRYFIAERAKTTRRFIKSTNPPYPISDLNILELDKHADKQNKKDMLAPLLEGEDIGVLSEAGCPGIADPGTELAALAHKADIQVVPLVGPSSILLALMGSGMNGQEFAFHGYLPIDKDTRIKALKRLEKDVQRWGRTQIFMEVPYRNNALFGDVIKHLHGDIKFCVACDLTLESEYILTKNIAQWNTQTQPELHKRPTMFLIGR